MAELDAIKKLRPTGGLMLRRDGSSQPWFGRGEILAQVQRISKKIILAASLRPELTFTSFGRHGGTTEASASGLHATLTDLGLADQLSRVLHVKLEGILGPPTVAPAAKPVKIIAPKKLPARISRVALIEKRIEIGLKLIELKAKARRNNDFSAMRKKHFGDVDPVLATEATKVARIYGGRAEIFRRASWRALVELSSPSLSTSARQRFEAAIRAGKNIKGPQIARARGRLATGRPKRPAVQPERMAA